MLADVGILGGGQLARMSIQAAQRMGLACVSLDISAHSPAAQIAPFEVGALDDPEAIARVLNQSRHVTLENEFIPARAIRRACELSKFDPDNIMPSIECLATIQDKLLQRRAFLAAGVPSPDAVAIDDDGDTARRLIGFPMVLKARFGGYDGKGTRYARSESEFESYRNLWQKGDWFAERYVPFQRELAAMVYVSPHVTGAFPTMESIQTNHVCDLVFPSGVDASEIAIEAVRAVGGRGLFGVEMFELQDGSIQINELAPRPHNSGHYTLDWGGVSQFEQHMRLACSLPVHRPSGVDVCMANLLGQESALDFRDGLAAALSEDGISVHWYGKLESRPGRKMGHINAVGSDHVKRAMRARERFYGAWTGRGA